MAIDLDRIGVLDASLKQLSIPIVAISFLNQNSNPPTVTVQYGPNVTQEQIDLANQKIAEFDWRRRRALTRLAVVNNIGALTAGQRALIDAHQRAEYLLTNPQLAALIGAAINAPIVVDEIDPTP